MLGRLIVGFLVGISSIGSVDSALELVITEGINSARPIAILPLSWNATTEPPEDIAAVVASDLKRSGKFSPIAISEVSEKSYFELDMNFDLWIELGVDVLFAGSISEGDKDSYTISYQLIDVVRGQLMQRQNRSAFGKPSYSRDHILFNKRAIIPKRKLREYAHRISDLIYEALTGKKGAFLTRIAYVVIQDEDFYPYQLKVSDYDGYNEKLILGSKAPLMSLDWSPDSKNIAYVTFQNGQAEIFIINVSTGKRKKITSFPRHNGAPRFSPDGKCLALVLSQTGSLQVYTLDLALRKLTRITTDRSNNTEPFWHPDGKSLIFTSDRGGKPQIYQVDLASYETNRLTFQGSENLSGQITPDGRFLVMVNRSNSGFNLAKQDLETGAVQILTNTLLDESPSIAPNGDMVVYSSIYNKTNVLSMVSIDGRFKARLPVTNRRVRAPAWSPFL
ncbi:protein tolB [Candidatus Photodesmus blepharus]|uniref:Tol-Pal system protein TolB n=1 Tax=Candidatus Photodesmus blepharonis TaxID=1179155 RepID=A0A084CPB7_9GAMM|nr:Tol-Pal system beta propeller repeat protein TolB [Candidatus Photodesmus blepharus]KEY91646.1 protein tolB [Candidatus Photodesmus blepharus]